MKILAERAMPNSMASECPAPSAVNRHVEDPCRLCQGNCAVDDGLPIEIRDSEEHLWLVIDERNDAIVGRQQTFLRTLYMTVVLRQDCPSFL